MNALFSLTVSIRKLVASLEPQQHTQVASRMLLCFVTELLRGASNVTARGQLLSDLVFLQQMGKSWADDEWTECTALLNDTIRELQTKVSFISACKSLLILDHFAVGAG